MCSVIVILLWLLWLVKNIETSQMQIEICHVSDLWTATRMFWMQCKLLTKFILISWRLSSERKWSARYNCLKGWEVKKAAFSYSVTSSQKAFFTHFLFIAAGIARGREASSKILEQRLWSNSWELLQLALFFPVSSLYFLGLIKYRSPSCYNLVLRFYSFSNQAPRKGFCWDKWPNVFIYIILGGSLFMRYVKTIYATQVKSLYISLFVD